MNDAGEHRSVDVEISMLATYVTASHRSSKMPKDIRVAFVLPRSEFTINQSRCRWV
jgi:hypothetical protein